MSSCAWVTHCLGEQDAEKALVLGKSLRRVLTRNSLAVIVNSNISQEWINILKTTFDFVIPIQAWDSSCLKNLITPDSLALGFALTLNFFRKCIFFNPGTLILKNCDDLFDTATVAGKEIEKHEGSEYSSGCPVYFAPSQKAFLELSDNLMECCSDDVASGDNLLTWITNSSSNDVFIPLDGPYFALIGLDEKRPLKHDKELAIANLKDFPTNLDKFNKTYLENAGLLEKYVYGYWLDLYMTKEENVNSLLPLVVNEDKEPIAVVGMSCRLPASKDLNEFWNLLIDGGDAIRPPPEGRWTKDQFPTLERAETKAGFLNVPVDEFDAKFFGISPKEVVYMDPQIRILHEVVWEGLEDAGINPANLKATPAGVFLGSYQNEYVNILMNSEDGEHFRTWMGNSISAGSARISHLLGLTGPSIGTNPACSASLAALHMSCQSLRRGECNMAIACASNLILMPFTPDTPGLDAITSPDGHCKTFDASADGFGRAEGCTVMILKTLSEAVKDGDRIWGLIRGTSLTQEGLSRSIGTPTANCEAKAMQIALEDGDVDPSEVSFIEAHGTGTVVGDTTEIHAISRVYGNVKRDQPLVIGSVKTNVGHTEACSGMTGIMKVFLSMKNEIIPRHRNFTQLNPNIDLESIPAQLPLEPIDWPKTPGKPRMAGVCSFGFTGMDGHAVVQEFDEEDYCKQKTHFPGLERPLHIMKISAKTEEALTELLERYKVSLKSENVKFSDIAYTANVGRTNFLFRAALIAPDNATAINMLENGRLIKGGTTSFEGAHKNICFLFTGQGSQYHGMAKQLYSTSPIFHSNFDYCDNFLMTKYGISLKNVFFSEQESKDAHRTLYSQPGIFVVEYCLLKLWESWGIKPEVVLGHSLGEFCAAVAAGILNLDDALTLVAERSSLIESLPSGKMLVVKLNKSATENQLETFRKEKYHGKDICLDFAAVNTPEQTVLAGDSEIIAEFKDFLKNNGDIKCSILHSTHAFHSRQMYPMLEKYRSVAEKITSKNSESGCTFISGMMGEIVDGAKVDANYWVRHTREKVNFLQASKVAYKDFGCRLFIEIGPHPVLSAMTMMNNNCNHKSSLFLPSLRRNESDWETILNSLGRLFVLGKADIDWNGFDMFYERSKVGQHLPTYPFKRTKFWPRIITPKNMEIHPLLGSAIPNPTQAKLFQSEVKPQDKLEYLKDHMIGDKIIFPGAGYMEMLLMAGHAAMGGQTSSSLLPKRPISILNFKTKAALGLKDNSGGILCQTVVQLTQDSEGIPVEMYHEAISGESSDWIQHASASFAPFYNNGQNPDEDEFRFYHDTQQNIANSHELKSTCQIIDSSTNLYEVVKQLGLNFGPTFRTLEKLWKNKETNELLAEVTTPKESHKYLLHPTLIDAMIQMALFQEKGILDEGKSDKKLFVPTGCDKFIWFAPLKTETCYIHANFQGSNQNPVVVLDAEGNLIAAICGVSSVETSVSTIKAMLETQVKSKPDYFVVEWIPTVNPLHNRVDFAIAPDPVQIIDEEPTDLVTHTDETRLDQKESDITITYYVIIALLKLGWSPNLADIVCLDELCTELKIVPEHKNFLRLLLTFLEEDGFIQSQGEGKWTVTIQPMTIDYLKKEVERMLERRCAHEEEKYIDAILLVHTVGKNLDKILTGRTSTLEILFPESESKPSAKKFYKHFVKSGEFMRKLWSKQLTLLKHSYKERQLPLPVLRILEVGAGTGAVSEAILESLHEAEVPFEYVYTDVSSSFFNAAEKLFEKYRSSMKFRKLNLEQDPASQGFPANYFDAVIAAEVIHATRDVRESLLNIKQLIRKGASLWLMETLGSDRSIDSIFGLLEGYWRFTDRELRPTHPMLLAHEWRGVLNEMGFCQFGYSHVNRIGVVVSNDLGEGKPKQETKSDTLIAKLTPKMQQIQKESEKAWLLFYLEEEKQFVDEFAKRFTTLERKKLIFVKHKFSGSLTQISDMEYEMNPDRKEDMDRLFKIFFKRELEKPEISSPPVEGLIVTWGITTTTMKDQTCFAKPFSHLMQNVFRLPHKAMPQIILLTSGQWPVGDITCSNPSSSTLIALAQTALNEHTEIKLKGIDIHPQLLSQGVDELFHEMFSTLDDDPSYFTIFRGGVRYLPRFSSDRNRDKSLTLPFGTSRFMLMHSKTKTVQDLQFVPLEQYSLGPNDIEVGVKCMGLNFRDVFSVLKPSPRFEADDTVGLDFSGVVTRIGVNVTRWKVGDAVCSFRSEGQAFPSHMQVHEDVAVEAPPSWTFAEAASMPTVFCTAHYCLEHYAKVKRGECVLIHTASGGVGLAAIQVAKEFGMNVICTAGSHRKRAYLRSLGIEHVFNSRTTDYGNEILRVTHGKGVDLVLNTLTGAGFKEATLAACGLGARFVEISKLNIWTEEDVKTLRPDVDYMVVDLVTIPNSERKRLLGCQEKWIAEGKLTPIPYTRFDAVDIRQALTFLQKAQHVGKVVCMLPEPTTEKTNNAAEQSCPLFNKRSTYLITGGLGGIGMEVCKYMVEQGAGSIILVGRNPPNEKTAVILETLKNESSCDIRVIQADVGVMSDCEKVFKEIGDTLPLLRGVMHVAGTLADGLLENLSWDKFEHTYQSKVLGSWNLHELTKNMVLEHFVLFSSFASSLASPGQGNYSSACKFEDGLTHFRNSRGLPATTINWGQFGEVGLAAEADLALTRPFSPQKGMNALDQILRSNRNHLTVAIFNTSAGIYINMHPMSKWMMGDLITKLMGKDGKDSGTSQQLSSSQFGKDYDGCKTLKEKIEVMTGAIKMSLTMVLRLNPDESIERNMEFEEMGMDSLMMIELQNFLQEILRGRMTLTQSAWNNCTTVNSLGKRLVEIMEGGVDKPVEAPPTLDEVKELILKDSKLPEGIQPENPGSEQKTSQIKRVLVTGATGFMGSHMLKELLDSYPQLDKIYCLVRKRQKMSPEQRILSAFDKHNIQIKPEYFGGRIVPIHGNLTEAKLGLSDESYSTLAEDVDAVIHFGAQVNQVEYYKDIPGGKLGARNVNVGGLLNVLEFACKSRTKHIFNASTIAAVLQSIEGNNFTEDWPDIAALAVETTSGYFASQYVCDALLKEATQERGIPCKSFRFSRAMGEPPAEGSLSDQSFFMKMILFSLNERIMPEKPIPVNIIPVQLAAKISAKIMFSEEAPNEIYNVFHPRPHLLQECLTIMASEMGFSMTTVDHVEGREKALSSHERGEGYQISKSSEGLLAEFENFFNDDNLYSFFSYANTLAAKFQENRDFFKSKKVSTFAPEVYCGMESSFNILKRWMDKVKLEKPMKS